MIQMLMMMMMSYKQTSKWLPSWLTFDTKLLVTASPILPLSSQKNLFSLITYRLTASAYHPTQCLATPWSSLSLRRTAFSLTLPALCKLIPVPSAHTDPWQMSWSCIRQSWSSTTMQWHSDGINAVFKMLYYSEQETYTTVFPNYLQIVYQTSLTVTLWNMLNLWMRLSGLGWWYYENLPYKLAVISYIKLNK